MYLTASIFINKTNPLFEIMDEYAFLCKNLKNSVIYHYRQVVIKQIKTKSKVKITNGYHLINQFTKNNQVDYCAIPRKVSQQIIIQVSQDFKSFEKLFNLYTKDNKNQKPSLPRYLHKTNGRANVIFTKQCISTKDLPKGILTLSTFGDKRLSFNLGKLAKKINLNSIQEVKFVKVSNGYDVKIIYRAEENPLKEDNKRYLSVDFGINNLMTIGSNVLKPIIINGKILKSFNQFYNEQKAKIQSELSKTKNKQLKIYYERRLEKLSQKRNYKVNDFLHKASRYLINHAASNNIHTIIIGYNQGWKQESVASIGKVNNQKFVFIPFYKLLRMIQYKAQQLGIKVIVNEESYTSKCSFLDNEPIQKHQQYKGKRIKRGLFKSALGQLINADLNGALNILRKVIGEFIYDSITVCSTPKTINVLKH